MTATALPTPCPEDLPNARRTKSPRPASVPDPVITTAFASEAARDRVFAWLDAGLRPGRAGRLAREYPLLFAPGSRALPITVWLGERPAAFCLLWPLSFSLGRGRLRTGLISLVYTDPRDRGRGLARAALARALSEARALGLGICLLWSELADFYTAQGFHRAGRETLVAFDEAILARAGALAPQPTGPGRESGLRIERARLEDWPAIEAIRRRRSCHARLPVDAAALAAIPDLEVRVARSAEGVVAFAMVGRGDDFPGVVHEWGGETEGVLRCCSDLLEGAAPERGLLLLSPAERSEVPFRLRAAGARVVRNPLAFFAIASLPALIEDLEALVPALARTLRLDPGALSEPELLALLFSDAADPVSTSARGKLGDRSIAAERAGLPLPFFVWGLESI